MGNTTTTETVTMPRRTAETLLAALRRWRDRELWLLRGLGVDYCSLAGEYSRIERELMDAMGR